MNVPRARWLLSIALVATLTTISAVRLAGQAPGATVTSVDVKTGVVTGKVNSTGQVFTFTLANKALLSGARPGQGVFVNLAKKISLDGKQPHGTILTLLPLGAKQATSTNSANTNLPPVSPLCSRSGGASNPLTADNFSKSVVSATFCFNASCGASTTISGNVFPAGNSDWLSFEVPAPRENCAMPVIAVSISPSSDGIYFDVLASPTGPIVTNSYNNFQPASDVNGIAGLGAVLSPLQPGTYYIKIYGGTASTVGTWTLKIAS